MGWFGKGRDENEPTLVEAWQMLADRMGVAVEELGERSIRAQGTVRGRGFFVAIEGDKKGTDLLQSFRYNPRGGSKVHVKWRSEFAVGCANPRQLMGTIESFVDIDDPRWAPGVDLNLCRVVKTDPPVLGTWVLSPSIHAQLMALWMDVKIIVEPNAVRLVDEGKSDEDGGYMVGSVIHQYVGTPPPWPERALAGPQFWALLLCEIAEAVDAAGAA